MLTHLRPPSALLVLALLSACAASPDRASAPAPVWHVKAIDPAGRFVDVKAVDAGGAVLDVKALATPGDLHLMDVKCLHPSGVLPVKLALAEGDRAPLCAIQPDGETLPIEALLPDGARLPVVGVQRAGNIVHVKALAADGSLWGVKAISPQGHLMDVKGVKLQKERREGEVHGVPILAHVKAIPQVVAPSGGDRVWHVKAIHPEGRTVDVKAIDADGAILDVKAFETSGNVQFMDVKALRDGQRLDVKVPAGEDGAGPVRVILPDGTALRIVALPGDGRRLEVRAVQRAGNILHIKAIAPDGSWWGVKALSPDGLLRDVKGVALEPGGVVGELHGVSLQAHVKALPQVLCER